MTGEEVVSLALGPLDLDLRGQRLMPPRTSEMLPLLKALEPALTLT